MSAVLGTLILVAAVIFVALLLRGRGRTRQPLDEAAGFAAGALPFLLEHEEREVGTDGDG